MSFISVPKALRDKLGDEASDSLVEMFRKNDEDQKIHLFDLLEDRFAHRLLAVESRIMGVMNSVEKGIRDDMVNMEKGIRGDMASMDKGIRDDMNHGFLDLQKQITNVHGAISNQTRWILVAVLSSTVLYPIIQKLLGSL